MYRTFLALSLSTILTAPALAQGWTVGAFGIFGPSHPGSAEDSLTLVPLIQYEEGPWTFGGQNIVAYEVGADEGLSVTSGIGFDLGQDEAGVPEVDFALTAFLDATYAHPYFQASATATQRVDDDLGLSLDLELVSGLPLGDTTFLALGLSRTYGDSRLREMYYGVDSSGLESTGFSATTITSLDAQSTLIIGANFDRLSDDLDSLSFVDDASSLTLNIGYSYSL